MTSLAETIAPKSDQLNADDLIGRSMTIEITDVRGVAGDQPIAIHFKGDNGKPWKPCKGMRRVLVFAWGADGKSYIGRSLTLYRDEKVKFGGIEVGGIRISHMSHISEPLTLALTVAKATRKPYVVQPLRVAAPAPAPAQEPEKPPTLADYLHDIAVAETMRILRNKFNLASVAFEADDEALAKLTTAKDIRKAALEQQAAGGEA